MRGPNLSSTALRRLTLVNVVLLAALIVSGAVVRLTNSGLGCADWPACSATKLVDVSTHHAAIEQLNRIFSGAIGLPIALALLGAYRLRPEARRSRAARMDPVRIVLGGSRARRHLGEGTAGVGECHRPLPARDRVDRGRTRDAPPSEQPRRCTPRRGIARYVDARPGRLRAHDLGRGRRNPRHRDRPARRRRAGETTRLAVGRRGKGARRLRRPAGRAHARARLQPRTRSRAAPRR